MSPHEGGGGRCSTNYGWLAWVGVALAFAAIEAATVDFVFLMLAGGALGGSAAAAVGAPFVVQVVAAVAVSGVLLGVGRPWAKRRFATRPEGVVMGTAAYIGRSALVDRDRHPARWAGEGRRGDLVGHHYRCRTSTTR